MSLCQLCSQIPFEYPPSLPKAYTDWFPALPLQDHDECNVYYAECNYASPLPTVIGYPYYRSEAALKQSENDCNLCRLIYHEFHKIIKTVSTYITDFAFFITRRENNQQGFVVWTYGVNGDIWRVGVFGSYVKDSSDPLSSVFKGYPIYRDTSGPTAKSTVKAWVAHCKNHHKLCGPPQGSDTVLPWRVIDLGTSSTSTPKLVETNGKMTGYYTILSYAQGNPPHPHELTMSNLSTYKSGINFSSLQQAPQTLVDAMEVTRLVNIRYLWIDSLCIIQSGDGGADWTAEGGKMMEYYGNSYLTISAAAGDTSHSGVFNQRDVPQSTDIPYTSENGATGTLTIFTLDPSKENIQASYLSLEGNSIVTRAWTLQERVLSTRNILFATDQMYYECNTTFQGEAGFSVQGRQYSVDLHTREISLFEMKKRKPRHLWDVLVQNYGKRKAFNTDQNKFMAFSGLAKKFGILFGGDEYIAGLWKETFIESLFWSTDRDPKRTRPSWVSTWPPTPYRAPSWSWACMDADIFNPDGRIYIAEKYATYVSHTVGLVAKPNPYGQIFYANVTLHVPRPIHLQLISQADEYTWARSKDPNEKAISVKRSTKFDYDLSSGQLQNMDIYALVLARDTMNSKDDKSDIYYLCLLVTSISGESNYRRMGKVWLDEEAMGSHAPQNTNLPEWIDVTLA